LGLSITSAQPPLVWKLYLGNFMNRYHLHCPGWPYSCTVYGNSTRDYRQRPPADGYLAVHEIVNTVFCEQQAVFIWQYGKKTTAQQQRRLERGIIEHKRFEAAGRTLQKQETDRRCFIASYVFGGNAPETSFLRQWRDNQLLLYWFGPSLVRLYYLLSPTLVKCFSFIPYSRPVLAFIIKRLFIGQIRRGL